MRSPADAAKGDAKLKELFFFDMLAQGIWMARRGMFTLCLPIGDAECDRLAAAVEEFLSSPAVGVGGGVMGTLRSTHPTVRTVGAVTKLYGRI